MLSIIRKTFIYLLLILITGSMFSETEVDDIVINDIQIYKSELDNVEFTIKYFTTASLILNCEIEFYAREESSTVIFFITNSYINSPVYIKTLKIQKNTWTAMDINSFKLSSYANYDLIIQVNNESYTWDYISTYNLNDFDTIFEPNRFELNPSLIPDNVKNFYLFDEIELPVSYWSKLSVNQKQGILDWVKIGGYLTIDDSEYQYNNKFYYDNFKSPIYEFIDVINRVNPYFNKIYIEDEYIEPDWEVNELNTMLFIPIIVIVALILGPGIVIFSKKKKKPVLMLVLIPVLSIFFSVILLIISIFQYGLLPKVSQTSVAYLDQITNEVIINQFTGIESPLGGPAIEFPEDAYVNPVNNSNAVCIVQNGKIIFSPKTVPAKVPVFFHMKRIYTDRRQLEIAEKAETITVVNALGTDLEYLKIAVKDGIVVYNNLIKAGESVEIDKNEYLQENSSIYPDIYGNSYGPYDVFNNLGSVQLFDGIYEAHLTENIFGVDIYKYNRETVGYGSNILLGVYKDYR